jgi:dTDP-4-dehydrorhamnose reductase
LRYERTLCVRTAAFFGCGDRGDFVSHALHSLANGRPFYAAADVMVSPTYLPDLANASLDLLVDGERGIFHLANVGSVSWAAWARLAATALDVDCRTLQPRASHAMNWAAQRPAMSVLRSERVHLMPSLEDALRRYSRSASASHSRTREPKYGSAGG